MDSYRANKEEVADLYPRPASAGCVNSNWCSSDPSSSLFGSSSGERLEHLVKSRPRKPKSRAPTRISVISTSSSPSSSSSSSSTSNVDVKNSICPNGRLKSSPSTSTSGVIVVCDKIDDGLDTFFCKSAITVTESITKTSVTVSTITPTIKLQTANSTPKILKQNVKPPPSSNVNVDKLQEKSTTSSKSPTKAIQKIIKSFEIRVNRESVK